MRYSFFIVLVILLSCQFFDGAVHARSSDLSTLGEEQANEKSELEQMREQLKALKETTNDAVSAYNKLDTSPLKKGLQEFHLFCRMASHEIAPGKSIEC